jgi:hypothetical protein
MEEKLYSPEKKTVFLLPCFTGFYWGVVTQTNGVFNYSNFDLKAPAFFFASKPLGGLLEWSMVSSFF